MFAPTLDTEDQVKEFRRKLNKASDLCTELLKALEETPDELDRQNGLRIQILETLE